MPSKTASIMGAAFLAGGLASALPELAPRQMSTMNCADVHIFLAKGNNEPYPGRQGKLVSAICSGMSSCDYEDIVMQNMLNDEYCGSVTEGTTNAHSQIEAYYKRCPNAKLVISGYSQGAQVVGDIFAGAGGTLFNGCIEPYIAPMDPASAAAKQIAAILTFGDVRHLANQPYNTLSGAGSSGVLPRSQQQATTALSFAGVWRDFCHAADPICAGGTVAAEHLDYFDVETTGAAEWVKEKVGAFKGDESAKPTSTTASSTSTKAASSTSTEASSPTASSPSSSSSAAAAGSSSANSATQSRSTSITTAAPNLSQTVSAHLPEATVVTTENLSAIPTTASPAASATTGSSSADAQSKSGSAPGASSPNRTFLLGVVAALSTFAFLS